MTTTLLFPLTNTKLLGSSFPASIQPLH